VFGLWRDRDQDDTRSRRAFEVPNSHSLYGWVDSMAENGPNPRQANPRKVHVHDPRDYVSAQCSSCAATYEE
jgi:hypothetical protein